MRVRATRLAAAASLALLFLAAQPESRLQTARSLLTGEHKDADAARRLLLEIVEAAAPPDAETLAYACVYLGYLEDRGGNRQQALAWFRKALAAEGASPGILAVARAGLERPVTWIRHLDQPEPASPPRSTAPAAARPPAKAYVTPQQPPDTALARNLTARERRENFEALWSALDKTYACFQLKGIDWAEVGRRYRARLDTIESDDAFYELLFQLVNELRDTHSWLQNYRPAALYEAAGVSVDLFEGRPFVVAVRPASPAAAAGAAAGWEVVAVDGRAPAEILESLRPRLHAASSERAWRREAGRHVLAAGTAAPARVELRSPEGRTKTVTLPRAQAGMAPPPPRPPVDLLLTRQRFVHFGLHPSGLGYIRIESFNGRAEIAREFDRALDELRDTPGLLLDIRDNPGGYGQPQIVGRLLARRTLTSIGYLKSGPRHSDLTRRKSYLEPAGPWQYGGPVALLVNDRTGSAADLFACELRSARRVLTVGTTTHGNLSGVAAYVVLPCGLVVRVSNGYLADARDRPIEVNGNPPDIAVEPTIADFLAGRDPVLERAAAALRR